MCVEGCVCVCVWRGVCVCVWRGVCVSVEERVSVCVEGRVQTCILMGVRAHESGVCVVGCAFVERWLCVRVCVSA